MPVFGWILMWAVLAGVLVFFVVRDRRSGRRVHPDALKRRREDTFRMHAAADHYDVPPKDPQRD